MKIGVADYGLGQWDGGLFDIEQRLEQLKAIGYEGTERLAATSASDALEKAARYRRLGMDFSTCLGPSPQETIRWTAGLGKEYVWTSVNGRDFDTFCRQVNTQVEACARWGVRVVLHNHLGTVVESQDELEKFLERCPGCGLVFDTAHLAAAGGDSVAIAGKYADRVIALHVKDWFVVDESIGLDQWPLCGRFCELDAGNIGLDNKAVVKTLLDKGYDGWTFVEQDTHLRDPMQDLAVSRAVLREAGV